MVAAITLSSICGWPDSQKFRNCLTSWKRENEGRVAG